MKPAVWVEEEPQAQSTFYDILASVDATAQMVVRRLLFGIKDSVDAIVWGMGSHEASVTAYVDHLATSTRVCTIRSNGMIELHLESLNTGILTDVTSLRQLRRLVQTLSETAFPEGAPFELLTVPVPLASSAEGFSNLAAALQELIRCLKYA